MSEGRGGGVLCSPCVYYKGGSFVGENTLFAESSRALFTNKAPADTDKHVYMYVCMYVCMYVYIYIYPVLLQPRQRSELLLQRVRMSGRDSFEAVEN